MLNKEELIKIYNQNPKELFSEFYQGVRAIKGSDLLTEDRTGTWWVLPIEEDDLSSQDFWVLPDENLGINPHKLRSIESLFECYQYRYGSQKFLLVEPAIVSALPGSSPGNRQWKLKQPGILDFGGAFTEEEILKKISTLSNDNFAQLCQKIALGLGFSESDRKPSNVAQVILARKSVHQSAQGDSSEETWAIVFIRPNTQPSRIANIQQGLSRIAQIWNGCFDHWLLVFFSSIASHEIESWHNDPSFANIHSVLLTDLFAADLAWDYGKELLGSFQNTRFSFVRRREEITKQVKDIGLPTDFPFLKTIPTQVRPVQADSPSAGIDILSALHQNHSLLLLGSPGSGKTTSLQRFAKELASAGAKFPVLMPLSQYSGDLVADLGTRLADNIRPLSEEDTRTLLSSGALTVILDGINELKDSSLRAKLIEEINQLTNPEHSTSRAQWIVSARKYSDTTTDTGGLEHLQDHIWELQPLTSDEINQSLSDGLGISQEEAQTIYDTLEPVIQESCTQPLLLNMSIAVYQDRRSSLDRQKLLQEFTSRAKIPEHQAMLEELRKHWYPEPGLTKEIRCDLDTELKEIVEKSQLIDGIAILTLSQLSNSQYENCFRCTNQFFKDSVSDVDNIIKRLSSKRMWKILQIEDKVWFDMRLRCNQANEAWTFHIVGDADCKLAIAFWSNSLSQIFDANQPIAQINRNYGHTTNYQKNTEKQMEKIKNILKL